ncbi:hypothetical protein FHX37_0955 [Haloactinospora alba]|uniref:Uncharacterized protein n=1 Tax=Haloactinospora alba TaxID=405555 RepID=A0A543NGT4_9ACTN|nr:hypothetical protein [Haloactinospora alba]TQN31066.1 hypothetical protein FHX37_0955 [Haloactinospora alba]
MTDPSNDDFEERLRAALRAEADSVSPSADALEKIRTRTERNRLAFWIRLPWLRPLLAVGATVAIAGSVLVGTPQVRDQILPGSFTPSAHHRPTPPTDTLGHANSETTVREESKREEHQQQDGPPPEQPSPPPAREDSGDDEREVSSRCATVPPETDGPTTASTPEHGGTPGERTSECEPPQQPSGESPDAPQGDESGDDEPDDGGETSTSPTSEPEEDSGTSQKDTTQQPPE